MKEKVIITVDAKGESTVEVQGVKGAGCSTLTRGIEAALGEVTADAKKPEYHQAAQVQTHVRR